MVKENNSRKIGNPSVVSSSKHKHVHYMVSRNSKESAFIFKEWMDRWLDGKMYLTEKERGLWSLISFPLWVDVDDRFYSDSLYT